MLQNLFVKRAKAFLIFLLSMVVSLQVLAQPDCRSILGSYIKPLGDTPLSWGIELTGAGALMNDRTIANGSFYAGLDYSRGLHTFYFEGAYKNWYNSAKNPDGNLPRTGLPDYNRPSPRNWGMRELFYSYGNHDSQIKAGVQSFKSPDHFLFDERMLGVSAVKKISIINARAAVGTVAQGIARYQDVCGNRHIYNILHQSQFNFVGKNPGETNFAAVFLNWKSGSVKTVRKTGNDEFESFNEFNNDEFSGLEQNSNHSGYIIKAEEFGLLFYEEFGTGFHENKYYSGVYSTIKFPAGFIFKTEFIDQYILNDHTIALWLQLENIREWDTGNISLANVSFLTKFDLDNGAHFYPAFSNLFLGEVMRLDAINLPLLSGTVKHQFDSKWKPAVQINAVKQLNGNQSGEIDLIAGVRPVRNLRLTGICSYMKSNLLKGDYWMTKLEARVAF